MRGLVSSIALRWRQVSWHAYQPVYSLLQRY
jgi:hypothetical protein